MNVRVSTIKKSFLEWDIMLQCFTTRFSKFRSAHLTLNSFSCLTHLNFPHSTMKVINVTLPYFSAQICCTTLQRASTWLYLCVSSSNLLFLIVHQLWGYTNKISWSRWHKTYVWGRAGFFYQFFQWGWPFYWLLKSVGTTLLGKFGRRLMEFFY